MVSTVLIWWAYHSFVLWNPVSPKNDNGIFRHAFKISVVFRFIVFFTHFHISFTLNKYLFRESYSQFGKYALLNLIRTFKTKIQQKYAWMAENCERKFMRICTCSQLLINLDFIKLTIYLLVNRIYSTEFDSYNIILVNH